MQKLSLCLLGVVAAAACGNEIRFAAVGDTGKGNDGQRQVAAALASKCRTSGCDFVLLLGDNIYESGVSSADDEQFQSKFEIPYAEVPAPFYAVLGNHDYGALGLGTELDKGQYEVDYTQRSTKWRMPSAYYHFTRGDAEIFALDTNMQLQGRADAQKTEVTSWIQASTSIWKIAIGHHPYLSNGPHGNAGVYDGLAPGTSVYDGKGVKDFFDAVVCGKVDLALLAHDHSRQWLTGTCQGTELAVSGAGSAPTSLPGNNPTRYQSLDVGFLYVRINGRTLTAEFVNADGGVDFTRTLTK